MPDTIAYKCTLLTTGAAGALDAISWNVLVDGDFAFTMVSSVVYVHQFVASSAAAESSPDIIKPDNAGVNNGRWIRQSTPPPYASAAEINTGTEAAKAIAPDQLTLSAPTLAGLALSLASSADGDMWYRASNVFARLAKGAANTKLFMNAGATAPEWANGLARINVTRDMTAASGDVAYTGAGFLPSVVIAFSVVDGADAFSITATKGTSYFGLCRNASATHEFNATGNFITLQTASGVYQIAIVASMDSDGFTLTWTKTGSPTGTAYLTFVCIR